MPARINETGNKYNEWTILEYIPVEKRENKSLSWLAKCSCGNIRPVRISDLRNEKSKSCGCLNHKKWNIEIGKTYGELTVLYQLKNRYNNLIQQYHCKCTCGNGIDLPADLVNKKKNCGCNYMKGFDTLQDMIGEKYGHLTIIGISNKIDKNGKKTHRICQCDCGNIIEVYRGHLKDGHTQSCGCVESFGEEFVYNFLSANKYNIKRQYKIEDCKDKSCLPFDIAILNNDKLLGLIEIQGKQHFNSDLLFYSQDLIRHDCIKKYYCNIHNIPLLLLDYRYGKQGTNFNKWILQIKQFLEVCNELYCK